MRKRGQASVFIMLGILIIFGAAFFLYANSEKTSKPFESGSDELDSYVGQCVQRSALKAAYSVGLTGGFIDLPSEAVHLKNPITGFESDIAYYYFLGRDISPELNENEAGKVSVANEISKYVERAVPFCISDLSMKDGSTIISEGSVSANAIVNDDRIVVDIIYPLVMKSGQTEIRKERFNVNVQTRLGKIYSYALQMFSEIKDNNGVLPKSYKGVPDVDYYIFNIDSKKTVYILEDRSDSSKEELLRYYFAVVAK